MDVNGSCGAGERPPGLRVIRPVADIPPNTNALIINQAINFGIGLTRVTISFGHNNFLSLVGVREILDLQAALGLSPSEGGRDEMAAHLEATLPAALDEELFVEARPFQEDRRKLGSCTFFTQSIGREFDSQQQTVRGAILGYFGIKGADQLRFAHVWQEKKDYSGLKIARVKGVRNIGAFRKLLKEVPDLIPDNIKLAGIVIEDEEAKPAC